MKKTSFLLIILFILLMSIFTSCTRKNDTDSVKSDNTEKTQKKEIYAPDFQLESINGDRINLSDYKGQKVMLNFWALWCPYCLEEMPVFEKFYQEYKDHNFTIITVNIEDSHEKVKAFVESEKLTFPVLMDKEGKVASIYGARTLPASLFIDEEGKIVNARIGAVNYDLLKTLYENSYEKEGENYAD